MARKTPSRLEMRKMAEAAESKGEDGKSSTKKKKATKKKATRKKAAKRTKTAASVRKRLVWGIFSGNLKEEARFPYDKRKDAEKKMEQLLAKGKKLYFIQPIKEEITEELPVEAE